MNLEGTKMCPDKTCYATHPQVKVWPYGHIWQTVTCRCGKLVDAQTPHPNNKGGNENSWLTFCKACDVYGVCKQTPEEIECLRKNAEKLNA